MTQTIIRSGLILAISMLVAGSCTAATKRVIIVDLSKSAKSIFPQYKSAIHQILSQIPLNIGDSVTIMGITDDSFGHSMILLQDSIKTILRSEVPKLQDCSKLPKDSFQYMSCVATNTKIKETSDAQWDDKWRSHFAGERERLLSTWDANKVGPYSSTTDVLGALKYAEQIFATWKGEKELFIFSDMRHNTRGIDVSRSSRLDSKLMDEIKRRELVPRLKDVSVTVRGVHTENTDPGYYERLEEFWKRLFRESGARLIEISVDTLGSD